MAIRGVGRHRGIAASRHQSGRRAPRGRSARRTRRTSRDRGAAARRVPVSPPSSSTRLLRPRRNVRSWDTKSIVPSKSRERLDQHLLGGEVEVVRRLVEHEEVRRVEQHPRHHQARLLAARQRPDRLVDVVARELEGAEQVAQRRRWTPAGSPSGAARRRSGRGRAGRAPAARSSPSSGWRRASPGRRRAPGAPATILSSVVLPAPFWPITHQRSPRRIVR